MGINRYAMNVKGSIRLESSSAFEKGINDN
jgi:hypothetical protein